VAESDTRYGRGALQTPNARRAAAKAVVGKKIRRLQGHVGSTPARGTIIAREPRAEAPIT